MKKILVLAKWIEEDGSGAWVATSNDVPGLVAEADTLEHLEEELIDLIPELLSLNSEREMKSIPTWILQAEKQFNKHLH